MDQAADTSERPEQPLLLRRRIDPETVAAMRGRHVCPRAECCRRGLRRHTGDRKRPGSLHCLASDPPDELSRSSEGAQSGTLDRTAGRSLCTRRGEDQNGYGPSTRNHSHLRFRHASLGLDLELVRAQRSDRVRQLTSLRKNARREKVQGSGMTIDWNEPRVELLKRLWISGETARVISEKLGGGITRNAVIGKAHRLGLTGKHGSKPAAPRRAPAAAPKRPNQPSRRKPKPNNRGP